MVGLDLRDQEKKFKDGRHVGLDFPSSRCAKGCHDSPCGRPVARTGFDKNAVTPRLGVENPGFVAAFLRQRGGVGGLPCEPLAPADGKSSSPKQRRDCPAP